MSANTGRRLPTLRYEITRDGGSDSRFGNSVYLLFAGYLCSTIGSGMVYPYMAVYVQQIRGLGAATAASALAVIACGTIVGSLGAGFSIGRAGPRLVGAAGLLLQGIGYVLIGSAADRRLMFTACVITGVGAGAFLAVLSPAISAICPPEQYKRAFAARYMMNNLGLGIGAAIAVFFLKLSDASSFELLYDINGGSYVVLLVLFWVALSDTSSLMRSPGRRTDTPKRGSFRRLNLRGDRRFILLLIVQVILVAAGFSQMQSVVPLFLRMRIGASTTLISIVLIVNCLGIVALQPLVSRFGARVSENRLLAFVGGIWAIAFGVGLGSSIHGSLGVWAVIAFCALFTLGECFYGPSFQPLLVRIAPPERLGQYSGISSSLWGATTLVAPPLGVFLVNSRWPYALWILCAAAGVVAALCSLSISPPADNDESP